MIYGYIRISKIRKPKDKRRQSSESRADANLSLSAQTRAINGYARLKSLGRGKPTIFRDAAVSASRIPMRLRPQGGNLDKTLVAGDHVVFAKLDRAFRNLHDFAGTMRDWSERGVTIHLLDIGMDTSSSVGKLVAGIMAAIAEWESRRIGDRIREAKAVVRAHGRSVNGRATIGHRLMRGGKLVRDQGQWKVIKQIVKLRQRGKVWREIAAELNRAKLKTGERRPWSQQACQRAYVAATVA